MFFFFGYIGPDLYTGNKLLRLKFKLFSFQGDSDRPASAEDLKKLDYLEMALKVRQLLSSLFLITKKY